MTRWCCGGSVLVLRPRSLRLVDSLVVLRAVLAWASALDDFLDHALECTNAHTALAMAGEGIVAREAVTAGTWIGLDAAVDLGVALEVVLADEALTAVRALELAVT